MEFRLLGPVEAVNEEGPAGLGAPKQRALLAVLLLNANEVVSRDRLVDQLWGDDPPALGGPIASGLRPRPTAGSWPRANRDPRHRLSTATRARRTGPRAIRATRATR